MDGFLWFVSYTSYKAVPKNVKVMEDKEKLKNCSKLKEIEEIKQSQTVLNSGLDGA